MSSVSIDPYVDKLDRRSMINLGASSFYGKVGDDQEGLLKGGLLRESTFLGAYNVGNVIGMKVH